MFHRCYIWTGDTQSSISNLNIVQKAFTESCAKCIIFYFCNPFSHRWKITSLSLSPWQIFREVIFFSLTHSKVYSQDTMPRSHGGIIPPFGRFYSTAKCEDPLCQFFSWEPLICGIDFRSHNSPITNTLTSILIICISSSYNNFIH